MFMEKVHKFTETIRPLQKPRGSSKFYRDSEPINNKVLALLKADQKNDAEVDSFKYLQQYICGLEQVQLLKFLRFVTGANIVSGVAMISVNFIKIQKKLFLLSTHTQFLRIYSTLAIEKKAFFKYNMRSCESCTNQWKYD